MTRSRRHNLPGAPTRSRGLSAAGGGSVAAIASATVSKERNHRGDDGDGQFAEHLIFSPCTAGVQERALGHPRRPRHAGNVRPVTDLGRGQRTALTCCSSLYEMQVTQELILRVPVMSSTPAGPPTLLGTPPPHPTRCPSYKALKPWVPGNEPSVRLNSRATCRQETCHQPQTSVIALVRPGSR